MWRFPFINTGCLNATYYFSDRLGEARTQSVAGWNKITLQKLFLLLMICSGGGCPPPPYRVTDSHPPLHLPRPVSLPFDFQARPHLRLLGHLVSARLNTTH